MSGRALSSLQQHVLGVLRTVGACDAHELSRHLLIDGGRLGSPLRGLENRGLVGRTYTGHNFGSGFAYVLTADGATVELPEFSDDDPATTSSTQEGLQP